MHKVPGIVIDIITTGGATRLALVTLVGCPRKWCQDRPFKVLGGGAHPGLVHHSRGSIYQCQPTIISEGSRVDLVCAGYAGTCGRNQVMLAGLEDGIGRDGHQGRYARTAAAGIFDHPSANINRCAARIVEFDKFVIQSVRAERAEFADHQMRWRIRGGCRGWAGSGSAGGIRCRSGRC